ncbi:VPLPA-CTERM sorting domain-containing protein [Thiohalobacter sp. IOR34]|uniref:VPLPA-CTERM sorting domain-containing protein n=1 Tax=Thiohalobacter sp. IOR34 TaxID=3057176 RepID=UPI0025AFD0FC|nr:VPLPA-CTERM sorting domain-containing protein [Thiohalobacter sp. IOR34]WJW74309.1 VPLPA-CTERM sorting domain-containing protein [Thiohalobacter sp. IOR34]
MEIQTRHAARNAALGLFLCALNGQAFASTTPYIEDFGNNSNLFLVDVYGGNGDRLASYRVNGGRTAYDPNTGTGTGIADITTEDTPTWSSASLSTATGGIRLSIASIATHPNGSLHLTGLMDWGLLGVSVQAFEMDWAVDYLYDLGNDVTTFSYRTLDSDGDGVPGTAFLSGALTGFSLDFHGDSTFLAYVDPQYPTYVPLPASLWLMGSGLAALAGLLRRRNIQTLNG